MFKLIYRILRAIFAILGLLFSALVFLWIYFCPFDLDYLKERFNLNYLYVQSQETPIQNENESITTHKEQKWIFDLNWWTNAFIIDLWDIEISSVTWEVWYTTYYYNPEYNTILHPLKFVFADNWYLWEENDYNCVRILKNVDAQDNPNECKLFTINSWLVSTSQKYNKIYLIVTAKDWAQILIQ